MHALTRRTLLAGASLTLGAAPLAAQPASPGPQLINAAYGINPYRTFESSYGCATETVEFMPDGGIRQGIAFCTQARVTVGRRSTDDQWIVRVNLNTVADPNLVVRQQHEPIMGWLTLQSSYHFSGPFDPAGTIVNDQIRLVQLSVGELRSIGSVDFGLLSNFPMGEVDYSTLGFSRLSLLGRWHVPGPLPAWLRPGLDEFDEGNVTLALVETTATTAPEPATWMLMATGLLAVGAAARRRRPTT